VWLVEDDASIRWVLERALRASGMVLARSIAPSPLRRTSSDAPDVLLTDIRMPGSSGIDLLREVRVAHPTLPVIVMTAHSDLPSAVSAYEGGAFEYLPKPFDIDQAVELVRRAGQTARKGEEPPQQTPEIPELLGKAPAMQQVFRAIGRSVALQRGRSDHR
jgi:two-component system nitrogen regulation response regulator GlnG